ncbi:MAG: Pr6Pr family membrane protein [Terriglobales bacterium]
MWRGLIAVLAAWGLVLHIDGKLDNLSYFTKQSNLSVALCFGWLWLRPWLTSAPPSRLTAGARGAVTVYIIVTGVVYATVLNGTYSDLKNVLSHAVVPVLVAVDWFTIGDARSRLRWWHPLVWLLYPVAYLGFVLIRAQLKSFPSDANRYVYPFLNLDTHTTGQFIMTMVNFIAGFILLGYALLACASALDRLRFRVNPAEDPGKSVN